MILSPSRLLLSVILLLPILADAYDNVKMLCLVNQERAKHGLHALGLDSTLTRAAQQHSNDQARMHEMSHDGSDGSSPGDRCQRAGFNWNSVAENVAYGYKDETTCMKEWMQSPGHRANILSPKNTMFGSAVAYGGGTPYYTQDFGNDGHGVRNLPRCGGGYRQGGGGGYKHKQPRRRVVYRQRQPRRRVVYRHRQPRRRYRVVRHYHRRRH